MEKSVNAKILKEVEKLVTFIQESDDYQDYLYLSKKLKKHNQALTWMEEIKSIQKQIVRLEVENQDTTSLEKEIEKKEQLLKEIPLYVEFLEKQEILNNYFQIIKQRLDDYFTKKLNM
ncbi:MAG: YlbF family regulator [bacterium]|nr:YlbF family regulator [bacterium]